MQTDPSLLYTFPGKVPTGPGKTMNWYGFKIIQEDAKDRTRLGLYALKEDGTPNELPLHFVLSDLNSLDRMIEHLNAVRPAYVEKLRRAGKLPDEESRRITVA